MPPGSYEVQAVYTGDGALNRSSQSSCGTEALVIKKVQPTISTDDTGGSGVTPSLMIGQATTIGDTATFGTTISGVPPTGNVTFTLFSDAACKVAAVPAASGSEPVGTAFSTSWTPGTVGTYYWGVSYPGDGRYLPVPSSGTGVQCGGANETLTVRPAPTTLSTGPTFIPQDSATLGGGFGTPGGSMTFSAFTTSDCSGNAAYTQTVTVSGTGKYNTTNSGNPFTVSSNETVKWVVTYTGDTNNKPAASSCGEAGTVTFG